MMPSVRATRRISSSSSGRALLGGSGQPAIGRQKPGTQLLGQSDVGGIVGGEVASQFEDSWQEALVSVAGDGKVPHVTESLVSSRCREAAVQQSAPQHSGHFDITERRELEERILSIDGTSFL